MIEKEGNGIGTVRKESAFEGDCPSVRTYLPMLTQLQVQRELDSK